MGRIETLKIRNSGPADVPLLERLYPEAFPEEDLLPLVRDLQARPQGVLSLVSFNGATLVGHAVFTMCGVSGEAGTVALLGPVAVAPAAQRQGVGGELIKTGLAQLEEAGFAEVLVLGDPVYYSRFGFEPGADIAPPYALPEDWRAAWQFLCLGGSKPLSGKLSVPDPWNQKSLWLP